MKNSLLFILVLSASGLLAQLPGGLKQLANSQTGSSFILKDDSGTLLLGLGGYNIIGGRYNNGLKIYKRNQWSTPYANGTFTDAMKVGKQIYITAYNGLYTYRNDSFLYDPKITSGTCLATYKNATWIGTMGLGLREFRDGGFHAKGIKINGKPYDSIYSMCPDGNTLWIGTSGGLVSYDGDSFRLAKTPVVPLADAYNNYRQMVIRSIQVDHFGRLWILNGNDRDTVPCLYFRENGKFRDAMGYYREQCAEWGSIPFRAFRLGRTNYGNILLGTGWGMIELSDRILNYPVNPNIGTYYSMASANGNISPFTLAYESPDGMLYSSSFAGIVELDRSTYDRNAFREFVVKPYIRNSNVIDINDISANTSNDGTMFNASDILGLLEKQPVMNAKSIGCAKATFTGALWMGGVSMANGDLRMAAQTYRQKGVDFVPGPINTNTRAYDSILSRQYNKVWKIDRETIDEFLAKHHQPGYRIPAAILDWPGNAPSNCNKIMAPYIDADHNGIYDPAKGDYPEIRGDQMLWWVFNDLVPHTETGGPSMTIQVNASCYAYKDIRLTPKDSNFIVNRTIFFSYRIANLGFGSIDDFYTGIFNDVDLGNYSDDYLGCDSTENAAFAFNGDNNDQGPYGFGKNPPMFMCKFLNRKMNSFKYFNNGQNAINGDPRYLKDYYAYMRAGYYMNDSLVLHDPFPSHRYPCKFDSIQGLPGDRRFVMSTRTDVFIPGTSFSLDFAYILLHDPNKDYLKQDCNKPKMTLGKIQDWYDNNTFPSKPYWPAGIDKVSSVPGMKIYPNPAHTILNIKGEDDWGLSEIRIFDQSGRLVMTRAFSQTDHSSAAQMDISGLAQGIYVIQVLTYEGIFTGKFVRQD